MMSHRTTRSNSIPIPIGSSRNIEDVISMPFVASPGTLSRPHFAPQSLSQTSPGQIRGSIRSLSNSYEPRIIRASSSRNSDISCVPISPTLSPTRVRRSSASNNTYSPTVSPRNPSSSRSVFNSSPAISPSSGSSFPQPAYLEHSALRHLLRTETPSSLPSSRYKADAIHLESTNPALNAYPYLRRERTPLIDSDDESFLSPPRDVTPPVVNTAVIPSLHLPTRWSDHDHSPLLSVSSDGRELSFTGTSCIGDKDAAAARSNYPIPPACGIYYYEVEIVNKGQKKGQVSIGFSGPDVRLSRLPGWEKLSWGYHGDDGLVFTAEKLSGSPYGPTYTTGDVIGCGIDFSQGKAFYTRNGDLLGLVFENLGTDCALNPSIGLRHQGESVRANFGQDPFQYDIEDHVHQQRNQVWTKIQSTPLDWNLLRRIGGDGLDADQDSSATGSSSAPFDDFVPDSDKSKSTIDNLVLSYLTHHGYSKTASAFKSQAESGSSSKASSSLEPSNTNSNIDTRTSIVKAVAKGDIDTALSGTELNYPGVLEKEQGLMLFKLRCRKFVELLLETAEALKRVKKEEEDAEASKREVAFERRARSAHSAVHEGDGLDGMDVDEDAFHLPRTNGTKPTETGLMSRRGRQKPLAESTDAAQIALDDALSYGQRLEMDYKADVRPEVRAHLKRTFSVVAYEDPLAVGGEVAEIAGQESRELLATELNQAILEFQGQPTRPALEIAYRQTSACLLQLGLMGVGAAVFADTHKEFFDA